MPILIVLKILCDWIWFNISVSSPAMRFVSALLWSDTFSFLWCQWTAGCRCKLALSFPINCLVPQPPLHLAQQAVAVQEGPAARMPVFDRPEVRCIGRAVLELKSVYRSRLSGLTSLCTGKIALSLCVWHSLLHHFCVLKLVQTVYVVVEEQGLRLAARSVNDCNPVALTHSVTSG